MLAEKKKRSFVSRPSSSLCSRMLFSTKDSCIRGQNQRPSVVDAHRVAESSSQFLNLSLFEEACTKNQLSKLFLVFRRALPPPPIDHQRVAFRRFLLMRDEKSERDDDDDDDDDEWWFSSTNAKQRSSRVTQKTKAFFF